MKRIFYTAILLVIVVIGCSKDDGLSPGDLGVKNLTKTWTLGAGDNVSVGGQDITADYTGFSITFHSNSTGNNTFEVVNGDKAFPVTVDTWDFTDDTFTSIRRGSDEVVMSVIADGSSLNIKFSTSAPSGGKVYGTFGDFEFNLTAIQ